MRCPMCDGTGVISLDVQFLPDVDIPCPECGGVALLEGGAQYKVFGEGRGVFASGNNGYGRALRALRVRRNENGMPAAADAVQTWGLGYLSLGEDTPSFRAGRRRG